MLLKAYRSAPKGNPSVRFAAASAFLLVFMLASMLAGNAQTWTWTYATQTPNNPLVIAQSTVAVSANSVRIAYTVPIQHHEIIIESCTADLRDIQDASTIRTQGTEFLLIRFRPNGNASCATGKKPAVALPADDQRYIAGVAAALNRSCCTTSHVAVNASPAASPAPTPAVSPSPSPSPTPTPTPLRLQDWVETEGVFAFVRIRNLSSARVTITGATADCRAADNGCGLFTGNLQIEPGSTATVTTITSTDGSPPASFRYHYTANGGTQTASASGSSAKAPAANVSRLSGPELRAAQAAAISGLRPAATNFAASAASAAPSVAPRLLKRGSSRLAIGQTGTALVRLTIAADGMPQDATIVSITNKQLSAAAIETAVSSTYAPAMQNGRAVAAKYVATFSFDGDDPALSSIPVWKRPLPSPSPTPETVPSASDGNSSPLPAASASNAAPPLTATPSPIVPLPSAPTSTATPMPSGSAAPEPSPLPTVAPEPNPTPQPNVTTEPSSAPPQPPSPPTPSPSPRGAER